ncbi:MAG: CHAT domain-containing protein [Candidatus Cryptobacteroides sp.]
MEDLQERIEIVRQYSMFCDFINSIAFSNQEFIQCAVVNTLNKQRLSRVIRSKQVAEMQWLEWNEISSSLQENEALMVYFIISDESDSWNYAWVIEKGCDYPQKEYAGHSYWSEEDAMDYFVKRRLENYNNIWIVDNNRMRFTDYINDNRFHRIFSYKSGNNTFSAPSSITAIGDINYNISTRIILEEPLEESARELNYLFECFGDKLKVIQGEDFTKSSLLDCSSDILHISTHGKFDIELLRSLNCDNPSEGINGNNMFRSCGIMLSGYNDDPKTNFLSAYDIMQMDLSHIDLVFLSACESASGKYLPEGNYSLAEAFNIAGVKRLIAFIDSVQENVASRFSEVFYEKVKEGHTYHDAFYETKLQVCPYIRIVYFE